MITLISAAVFNLKTHWNVLDMLILQLGMSILTFKADASDNGVWINLFI